MHSTYSQENEQQKHLWSGCCRRGMWDHNQYSKTVFVSISCHGINIAGRHSPEHKSWINSAFLCIWLSSLACIPSERLLKQVKHRVHLSFPLWQQLFRRTVAANHPYCQGRSRQQLRQTTTFDASHIANMRWVLFNQTHTKAQVWDRNVGIIPGWWKRYLYFNTCLRLMVTLTTNRRASQKSWRFNKKHLLLWLLVYGDVCQEYQVSLQCLIHKQVY